MILHGLVVCWYVGVLGWFAFAFAFAFASGMVVMGRDVLQGVAMDFLKYRYCLLCPTLLLPVGSYCGHPQFGAPAAIFLPL
jgi:hypothetical protein